VVDQSMKHDEVQQILDNFTLRQSKRRFMSKKEIIFPFGERIDDGDGIRYSWPEAVKVEFCRRLNEGAKVIVASPIIISLKLRMDSVSHSTAKEFIPKDLPDFLSEIIDRYESEILLTKFDELNIHRIK